MGKLSRSSAINYLKTIFNNVASDYVDIEATYSNLGLEKSSPRDRDRIYEWLRSMEEQGLIEKRYTDQKKLRGLQLTASGHSAIRSEEEEEILSKESRLARWRTDAEILQVLYPDFEIVYDMRLRKHISSPSQES